MEQAAARLFEAAERASLTDAELARRLDASRSTISKMRSGERGLGLDMRERVVALFPELYPDLFPPVPLPTEAIA